MEVDSGRDKCGALYWLLPAIGFLYPIMSGLIELAFLLEDVYLWNGQTTYIKICAGLGLGLRVGLLFIERLRKYVRFRQYLCELGYGSRLFAYQVYNFVALSNVVRGLS